MTNETTLLTPKEAAQILKVQTITVKEWGRRGKLPRVKFGTRCIRFKLSDVLGLIEQGAGANNDTTHTK